jgi:hypothetical protein
MDELRKPKLLTLQVPEPDKFGVVNRAKATVPSNPNTIFNV